VGSDMGFESPIRFGSMIIMKPAIANTHTNSAPVRCLVEFMGLKMVPPLASSFTPLVRSILLYARSAGSGTGSFPRSPNCDGVGLNLMDGRA